MHKHSRTFRLFVSSTFSDLKEERNVLQKNVFPKLRDLCRRHGCRFQAIDLRWGIRDAASLDQKTMKICLEEITRCRKITPRPNFLVLLGDRYGWRPPPHQIPASEFEVILSRISREGDIALLKAWYQRDDNAVPPVYDLLPRTGQYTERAKWEPIERKLRTILLKGARQSDLGENDLHKYQASATEQEIRCGALDDVNVCDHIFCFFRTLTHSPPDKLVPAYVDLNADGTPDRNARDRLAELKNRLECSFGKNIFKYDAEFSGQGLPAQYLNQFQADVMKSLERVITREIDRLEEIRPLEEEILRQAAFGDQLISPFKGRERYLEAIEDYINGTSLCPYIVHGMSGSGKSALLAKAAKRAGADDENNVILRFIGATPESSDGSSLLESLCRQIYQNFDFETIRRKELADIKPDAEDAERLRRKIIRDFEIDPDYQQLSETFTRFIAKIPPTRKVVIFIDALDNLPENDNAHHLNWLPSTLPTHIRIVASCLTGEALLKLERRLPEQSLTQLEPMPVAEGGDLLKAWLTSAGRTLQPDQAQEVLGKFAKSGLPLYLRLAFEEARRWKSYDPRATLNPGIQGIISEFFGRLSATVNHGDILVSRSMGYLAAAKNGLTEDELIDILSLDPVVFKDFRDRAHHELDETKLPVVVWLRLYHDLEGYLTEASADGTVVMRFYHRQLLEAAARKFLSNGAKQKCHNQLADYFGNQPLWAEGEASRVPNRRKVSELPHQQINARLWDAVDKTLCDLSFIDAKIAAGMAYGLAADYNKAFESLPEYRYSREREHEASETLRKYAENLKRYAAGRTRKLDVPPWGVSPEQTTTGTAPDKGRISPERVDRLRAFAKFAGTHGQTLFSFRHQAGFCFQQAYNSALSGPVVDAAESIVKQDATHRMLLKVPGKRPYPGSTSYLSMVLKGHSGSVDCLRLSIDARKALSGSSDRTLRLWDLGTGECISVLKGHAKGIFGIDLTADAAIAASVSYDETIRIWDLDEHRCIRVIETGREACGSVSISPDGKTVISAGDGRCRIWSIGADGYAGEDVFPSSFNTSFPVARLSANGQLVFALAEERIEAYHIPLWETLSAEHKEVLDCLADEPLKSWSHQHACCLDTTPDGLRAVYGGFDHVIRLYDVENQVCLERLWGHEGPVNSVSMTPNGKRAVSGSDDRTVRVWDLQHGICLAVLRGIDHYADAVQISADGRTAVSSGIDGSIHLWDLRDLTSITESAGHADSVNGVAIAPGGFNAVSISSDRTMRLWDVQSNRCLKVIRLPDEYIKHVCISEDARRALTGGLEIKLWDLENGSCIRTIDGHQRKPGFSDNWVKPALDRAAEHADNDLRSSKRQELFNLKSEKYDFIKCLVITDDGSQALSATYESMKIWDLETGVCKRTITGKQSGFDIEAACLFYTEGDRWSEEKRRSFYRNNFVRTSDGKIKPKPSEYLKITCVSMTPGGRTAMTGSSDGKVRFWDLTKGECWRVQKGHRKSVVCVHISPDGKHAVSCDVDGRMEFWNLAGGRSVLPISAETRIRGVYLSADLKRIVAATDTEDIYIWDQDKGTNRGPHSRRILRGHQKPVSALSVTPDGKRAITGSVDGTVETWDLDKAVSLSGADKHTGPVFWVDSTRDGQTIVSASCDQIAPRGGTSSRKVMNGRTGKIVHEKGEKPEEGPLNSIRFWRAADGRCRSSSANLNNNLNCLSISPDGQTTFYGYGGWLIATANNKSRKQVEFGGHRGGISAIRPTLDGRCVLSADSSGKIRFWEIRTGKCLKIVDTAGASIAALDISPDGRIIAAPSGNVLRIWDSYRGTQIREMNGHEGDIHCVKISPDGRKAVSVSDKSIRIWSLKRAKTIQHIKGHTDTVRALNISPDGRLVLSSSDDKTIRAWEMESGKCLAIYRDENELTQLSMISPECQFACGTRGNDLLFLNGHNIHLQTPWVTAYRVDSISGNQKSNREKFAATYFLAAIRRRMKRLSDDTAAFCPWCGRAFPVADKMKNRIQAMRLDCGLSHGRSACLELPEDAWEDPWLKSTCPVCSKPLQFNPFIMDHLELT